MKNNNPKPLNEYDDYESIVNARTREHREQAGEWITKQLKTLVFLLSVFLLNLILWLVDVIPAAPSILLSEVLTCVVSFIVGQLWEAFRR